MPLCSCQPISFPSNPPTFKPPPDLPLKSRNASCSPPLAGKSPVNTDKGGRCLFPLISQYLNQTFVGFFPYASRTNFSRICFVHVFLAKNISFAACSLQALHIYWPIFLEHLQAGLLLLTKVKSPVCHSPHTNPGVLLQPETDRLVSLRPLWPVTVMETCEKDTLEIMTQLEVEKFNFLFHPMLLKRLLRYGLASVCLKLETKSK